MSMELSTLLAALDEAVPGASVEAVESRDAHLTLVAEASDLSRLAPALRDRPDLGFTYLAELTAVDYWPRDPRFEVVYLLVSLGQAMRLRLKIPLRGERPSLTTVSGVWPAANWLEREVWDMFGIEFAGHPDLRRLLMPDDWEGYPLRKDAPVQVRKPVRASEPLQMSEEEFRANLERDRHARQS
jgi:NADH-quinone oxidoreductase subunit C